jgi:tripartite-type tricarboxylate transporter receptor subunit TctC
MVQDLLGGHVDLLFGTPQQLLPLVSSGQLKAYGITAREASPQFPGAASLVAELGPKLEIYYWHALFAPAATPKPVVDQLNAVVQGVLDDAALMKSWADTGVTAYPENERSPQGAQALFKSEIERWSDVVRDNKIQPVD